MESTNWLWDDQGDPIKKNLYSTLWWTNIAMDFSFTIFNGKIHYKWPFSIAILVHQRVTWPWSIVTRFSCLRTSSDWSTFTVCELEKHHFLIDRSTHFSWAMASSSQTVNITRGYLQDMTKAPVIWILLWMGQRNPAPVDGCFIPLFSWAFNHPGGAGILAGWWFGTWLDYFPQ